MAVSHFDLEHDLAPENSIKWAQKQGIVEVSSTFEVPLNQIPEIVLLLEFSVRPLDYFNTREKLDEW